MKYALSILFILFPYMMITAADFVQFPDEEKVTLYTVMKKYDQSSDQLTSLQWYTVLHLMIGIDWPHDEEQESQCGEWRRLMRKKKSINDIFLKQGWTYMPAAAQLLRNKIENNK